METLVGERTDSARAVGDCADGHSFPARPHDRRHADENDSHAQARRVWLREPGGATGGVRAQEQDEQDAAPPHLARRPNQDLRLALRVRGQVQHDTGRVHARDVRLVEAHAGRGPLLDREHGRGSSVHRRAEPPLRARNQQGVRPGGARGAGEAPRVPRRGQRRRLCRTGVV